jgi:hypothetical protein
MSSKFMATLLSTFMKMVSLSLSLSLSLSHIHTCADTHSNSLGSCSMRILLESMLSSKKVYFMYKYFSNVHEMLVFKLSEILG